MKLSNKQFNLLAQRFDLVSQNQRRQPSWPGLCLSPVLRVSQSLVKPLENKSTLGALEMP